MNKRIMLIDGDNLLYRAYFKFGGLTNKKGSPSGCIYGFPYMLRSLLTKVKPDIVICSFDGGRNAHRLKALPTYKQREPKLGFDHEDFKDQKRVIMGLLPNLNCWVSHGEGLEADDLIYLWTRKYKGYGVEVALVSADKDFHQLIDEGVSIYHPGKEIFLTSKNLRRYFNYTPQECVDYLCLDGDKSDKIPGVPGMGEVRIRKFLDKYGTISNYLKKECTEFPKLTKELYNRNRFLIDLGYFYRKTPRIPELPLTTESIRLNMIEIAKVSRAYDINTFVKTDFISGFKKLGL